MGRKFIFNENLKYNSIYIKLIFYLKDILKNMNKINNMFLLYFFNFYILEQ